MSLSTIATPYALALMDLATHLGNVAVLRDEFDALAAALPKSRELQVAFSNPTISVAERQKIVSSLADANNLSTTTRNALLVLAEKGRLVALGAIATEFGRLADEAAGIVRAEVRSSVALTAPQIARLQEKLATVTGKTVTVENKVDADLIGGIQVHVDGTVYDTSVATRLTKLRAAILQDL